MAAEQAVGGLEFQALGAGKLKSSGNEMITRGLLEEMSPSKNKLDPRRKLGVNPPIVLDPPDASLMADYAGAKILPQFSLGGSAPSIRLVQPDADRCIGKIGAIKVEHALTPRVCRCSAFRAAAAVPSKPSAGS
jgi:hypothetical protein